MTRIIQKQRGILFWFCFVFLSLSFSLKINAQKNLLYGLLKCETDPQGFTLNYYYDNERRLISTITKHGQRTTYNYYDTYIVKKEITSSVVWYIDTLFYNPARLIGYSKRYMKRGRENVYDLLCLNHFFYNNEKYLTEWWITNMYLSQDTARIIQYIIEDGNVIREQSFKRNQPDRVSATAYTYYPKEVNSLGNEFIGTSFFGMSSINPIKEAQEKDFNNKPKTRLYLYEYKDGKIYKKSENKTETIYEYY